jgi:hypothetical protein
MNSSSSKQRGASARRPSWLAHGVRGPRFENESVCTDYWQDDEVTTWLCMHVCTIYVCFAKLYVGCWHPRVIMCLEHTFMHVCMCVCMCVCV